MYLYINQSVHRNTYITIHKEMNGLKHRKLQMLEKILRPYF